MTSLAGTGAASLESTEVQYRNLCAELNMDSETSEAAWASYSSTRTNYTLEGEQLHWLACALYVACRRGSVPTVGQGGTLQGNGVSLTRLLRSTHLSLLQFFNKARKWADMCNLKKELREKVDKLERNFNVSNVIFRKFSPIFCHIFKDPAGDPPKVARSRKSKRPPCTAGELFDFTWTLYIREKAAFPCISDDLVNSYHLLLAACDFVFSNAVMDRREDLLNPNFDCGLRLEEERLSPPCILEKLCSVHDGIVEEVKAIREHFWNPDIKKCFETKLLRGRDAVGEEGNTLGVLDSNVFDLNCKNICKDYETFVLSIGEYDERVFLGEEANTEIGTPTKRTHDLELGQQIVGRRNVPNFQTQFSSGQIMPTTPLSGRHYIKAKEQQMVTPVSSFNSLVSHLNKMVAGKKAEPGPALTSLVISLSGTALQDIISRVETMGRHFFEAYTAASESRPASHASFASIRQQKGTVLYYRVLEKILTEDHRKKKNIQPLLTHSVFHEALFTACLEVVIFSYNSTRTFPWALQAFQLEPFYFYKVIEILIRSEGSLARDVVKHLQWIEEQILESQAWVRSSPVWEDLAACEAGVPSCEEVSLPVGECGPAPTTQSPLSRHSSGARHSPVLADRFKSPTVTALARRQLFGAGGPTGQSLLAATTQAAQPPSPMKSGLLSQQPDPDPQTDPVPTYTAVTDKPKRTGSLPLFFRKVYNLAHLRLENLCQNLQLPVEILRRIWTFFEWTLMNHCNIMKDRHLDQIIMCALYVTCKVSGSEYQKNFTDILKHYRIQPQSDSHVYRSVLLRQGAGLENVSPAPACPPTPGKLAASSTVGQDGEERGDLIMFFNSVFLKLAGVEDYALKFSSKKTGAVQPPLSPLPQLRANPASPCRKVSDIHNVFIKPLKPVDRSGLFLSQSPVKTLSYSFSKSPAKDLAAINEMIRSQPARNGVKRKVLLQDDDEVQTVKKAAGEEGEVLVFGGERKDEAGQ